VAEADGRGSSAYAVWVDGRARLIVDLGRNATGAFGSSGAQVDDVEAILLTHLHVDHAGDLPAFVKSASFGARTRPLTVLGPSGSDEFPSINEFLTGLFGEQGVFRYLRVLSGKPFALRSTAIDVSLARPTELAVDGGFQVRAIGVPHGPVPALAYAVEVLGRVVLFMGDQRADAERLASIGPGADLLVAHLAIGTDPSDAAARLHATPDAIGEAASRVAAKRVVLSHLMARALADVDESVNNIERHTAAPVQVARDGTCIAVTGNESSVPEPWTASRAPETTPRRP